MHVPDLLLCSLTDVNTTAVNMYAHQPNIELVNQNQLEEGGLFSKETHL
jgi:hypothetical protein